MQDFEYYNPVTVVFGPGKLSTIEAHCQGLGNCAMIVSYEDISFLQPSIDLIHSQLETLEIKYVDYFAVQANPTLYQAEQGVELCRQNGVDFIIGFGGGSVMDCAKVIAAGVPYPHNLSSMILFSHSDTNQILPQEALPMIQIPTLPATGSEMNATAVITDEKSRKKSYVWAPCLYAKTAVLDPCLTVNLPQYQTVCGAIDTIAHVAESYLNGSGGGLEIQDNLQEGLIKAVLDTLPKVIENPQDITARGTMMWAASIALNGWLLAGTYGWAPMHQMSHVISARFGATHGATLGVMMVAWMRFFESQPQNQRYAQFSSRIFGCELKDASVFLKKLLSQYGMPVSIREFGVTSKDVALLVQDVQDVSFGENNRLASVPEVTRQDVLDIYMLSMAEK